MEILQKHDTKIAKSQKRTEYSITSNDLYSFLWVRAQRFGPGMLLSTQDGPRGLGQAKGQARAPGGRGNPSREQKRVDRTVKCLSTGCSPQLPPTPFHFETWVL